MRYNVLKSCAALSCRACVDETTCVAEQYLTLRTGCSRGRTPKVVRPQQRKNPLPYSFSQRSHIGNLRQIRKQGKGRSSKRKENRRLSFLFAPAAGAATSRRPQTANPPLRFSGKLPARKGRTRLRQFAHPGFPVQKRRRPSGRTRSRSSSTPLSRCRKQVSCLRQHRTIKAAVLCGNFVS